MLINVENKKLEIFSNDEKINLPEDLKHKIDENWNEFIKQTPELWNGEVIYVNNVTESENEIKIYCKKTNYSHYLYDQRIGCPKEYGSYELSAGILLETLDGYYVIGKLAETTSLPNGLTIQGGGIDKKDISNGKINVISTMERELKEEINIDLKNKNQVETYEVKFISPPIDKIKTYEVCGKAKLNFTAEEVKEHYKKYENYLKENNLEIEYKELLFLKKDTAYEELIKMNNPKRKYLVELIKTDSKK